LSEVPNALSPKSKKANCCQTILGPRDLAVVVGERAPYRRPDPGTEIDLRASTNVVRVPESESATDYGICGKPQQAFLYPAMNVEITGRVVRPRLVQVKHVSMATKSDLDSPHHEGGLDARHELDSVATRLLPVLSARVVLWVCQYLR
jgi:hypothetical protein